MKKIVIFLFLFALGFYPVFSQNTDLIKQIRTSGMDDILSFQTRNNGVGSFAEIQQVGNKNTAGISQQTDAGSAFTNQAYSIQEGNSNKMTIDQIGSGNLLLGFQLGYLTSEFSQEQTTPFGFALESFAVTTSDNNSGLSGTIGDNNKLTITQEGTNNNVMAIQQGSDNSISAEQKGDNNYLVILQKGKNNFVTGYKQQNTSSTGNLFDTIIQEGEGLSLYASDVSELNQICGNTFTQSGTNLSLQVTKGFVNSTGGIEITQTGRDMKVVIDQSYFTLH